MSKGFHFTSHFKNSNKNIVWKYRLPISTRKTEFNDFHLTLCHPEPCILLDNVEWKGCKFPSRSILLEWKKEETWEKAVRDGSGPCTQISGADPCLELTSLCVDGHWCRVFGGGSDHQQAGETGWPLPLPSKPPKSLLILKYFEVECGAT